MLFIHVLLVALLATLGSGIIVDDTSQLITYSNSPSWSSGTESQPSLNIRWPGNSGGSTYGGTWHEAGGRGASLTFEFTGTAVSVVGIIIKTSKDIRIGFTIDGGAETIWEHTHEGFLWTDTAEDFTYGVQVFSTSGLSSNSHTLVLRGYLVSFVFALDYIEYTPADTAAATNQSQASASQSASGTTQQLVSPSLSSSPSGSIIPTTDMATLSGLSSLPGFSMTSASSDLANDLPTIPPSDPRIFYGSSRPWIPNTSCGLSSMVTSIVGATISFNFTGPDIWVYTAANQQGGKYEVALNGTSVGVVETSGSTCKTEASYHIGNLDNFVHTLQLTNLGSSSTNAEIAFVGLRLASSVDQNTGFALFEGGMNKAAIAGGVLGGVAALFLVGFAIYLCLRRQRQQELLGRRPIVEMTDDITPGILPKSSERIPLTEKQQLALVEYNNASSAGHSPAFFQSHEKPPIPNWANRPSLESSGENDGSYHAEAMGSRHQFLITGPNLEAMGSGAAGYQTYVKPPVPYWLNTSEDPREQMSSHPNEIAISQEQHQRESVRQRLALANPDNASSAGHGPVVYQSHVKPAIPNWANLSSLEGPGENDSSYHVEAIGSRQQLLATELDMEVTGSGAVGYQTYVKPPVPRWFNAPEALGELTISQQLQQREAAQSPPSPSFRTRPLSGQRRSQDVHSTHPIPSRIASNEQLQPYNRSTEQGRPFHPPEVLPDDEGWPSAPPYVEDVLARPDARNLSENDVDTIARRLAEVMRVQNTARGGPGLLRERVAPPRELLDQLVEEHLGAREDTN